MARKPNGSRSQFDVGNGISGDELIKLVDPDAENFGGLFGIEQNRFWIGHLVFLAFCGIRPALGRLTRTVNVLGVGFGHAESRVISGSTLARRTATCRVCDKDFEPAYDTGRPPKYCPDCQQQGRTVWNERLVRRDAREWRALKSNPENLLLHVQRQIHEEVDAIRALADQRRAELQNRMRSALEILLAAHPEASVVLPMEAALRLVPKESRVQVIAKSDDVAFMLWDQRERLTDTMTDTNRAL